MRSLIYATFGAVFVACGASPDPAVVASFGDAATPDATHGQRADAGDHADAGHDGTASDSSMEDAGASPFDASFPPPNDRLLFVGNSFTSTNDLPGTFLSMTKAWSPSATAPYVTSIAIGGNTLTEYLADLQPDASSNGLTALLEGSDAGPASWTDVMLQEQSEIPGFALDNPERMTSMNAVVGLSKYVVAAHGAPVLVMTWGYLSGDSANPTIFPDFATMEGLLETGYRQMAAAVVQAGYPVRIAPVGPAFKSLYSADLAAGRSPTASGSLFLSLYESDGKHPAAPATYLMALVLMATLYDVDPTSVSANPVALIPTALDAFRKAARDAVVAERAYEPY